MNLEEILLKFSFHRWDAQNGMAGPRSYKWQIMKLEEVEKGREKEVIKENNKSALS